MALDLSDVTKLLLALLVGGLFGAEREYHDKVAGFRTLSFICVGAALFTIFSVKMGRADNNTVRIAAQIVSGVGFLGAGVVMRDGGRVTGVTTAAMIWLVAALGMGIGGGYYLFSLFTTGVMLLVQMVFPTFERWINDLRDSRTYEVACPLVPGLFEELDGLFASCGLRVRSRKRLKNEDEMIAAWYVYGTPKEHARLVEKLFEHPQVMRFRD